MDTGTIVLIAIAVIILFIVIWAISNYNGFIRKRNSVEEAFSTMDVYLKKRFDLIPNLVQTVKGYAAYEKDTLEKIVQARNITANAKNLTERLEGENQLTSALRTLFNVVVEQYPDLKANASFMDLQRNLTSLEGEIASSRKYYNAIVKDYNIKREVFPSSIIAGMFNFEKKPLFDIPGDQRENVKVDF